MPVPQMPPGLGLPPIVLVALLMASIAPLAGCGLEGFGYALTHPCGPKGCTDSAPPTHEEECASRNWAILGLAPELVPDTPDQLLKAKLRVGDAVELRVTTLAQPGECDDLVTSVAWRSTAPATADVVPAAMLKGRLEARSPGETALTADVGLRGGAARQAELYAVPAGRSTQLRVYGITVTR